jgi:5-methylcytosine-specific restriction endonuclease McrA
MDDQQCQNCGTYFSGHKRKFCSRTCNARYQARKYRGYDLSVFEKPEDIYQHVPMPVVDCPVCGNSFKAALNPVGKGRDRVLRRQKFCSKDCFNKSIEPTEAKDKIRDEIGAIKRLGRMPNGRKPIVAKTVYLDRKHTEALHCHCRKCGGEIKQNNKQMCTRHCKECRKKASIEARRKERHKYGKTLTHKKRAEKYGVPYELINRVKVFEMYGWKCAECKKHTPKDIMRTFDNPDAPTLDHIVPISKGGPHLYSNVQLLCRQCNYMKSDAVTVLL